MKWGRGMRGKMITNTSIWNEYLEYLEIWKTNHSDPLQFIGMSPDNFEVWRDKEYPEIKDRVQRYNVTISETMTLIIQVDAKSPEEAIDIAQEEWNKSEYLVSGRYTIDAKFTATEQPKKFLYIPSNKRNRRKNGK